MTFDEILAQVVDRTPGALAAVIMGGDGIAVADYTSGESSDDLQAAAVEFQRVLEEARKVAGSLPRAGELDELVLVMRGRQLLFRQVDEEYFVGVALEPTGSLGKARFLIRTLLQDLKEEL